MHTCAGPLHPPAGSSHGGMGMAAAPGQQAHQSQQQRQRRTFKCLIFGLEHSFMGAQAVLYLSKSESSIYPGSSKCRPEQYHYKAGKPHSPDKHSPGAWTMYSGIIKI